MYYHVIVEKKSDKFYGEEKTDLTKEQLISRFINPYEQGLPIVINGTTIHPNELKRITIKESEKTIESFIPGIKAEDEEFSGIVIGGPSYTQRAIGKAKDVTDEFIAGPIGYMKSTISQSSAKIESKNPNLTQIFVVHGRDEAAQSKVARFIEKLGFEAIILHEKASAGRTIIEKIEDYSNVGFAVVLYTPDDVGSIKSKPDDLNVRARQNVVFEHGYLVGKLGRRNVAALVDGKIELPNDISGVVYIGLDEGAAWQLQLAKEMKQSGYEIDMNKLI